MAKGNVITVSQENKSNLVELSTKLTSIDSELESLKQKKEELKSQREECYSSLETLANEAGLLPENIGDKIFLTINPDTGERMNLGYKTRPGYRPDIKRCGAGRYLFIIND